MVREIEVRGDPPEYRGDDYCEANSGYESRSQLPSVECRSVGTGRQWKRYFAIGTWQSWSERELIDFSEPLF